MSEGDITPETRKVECGISHLDSHQHCETCHGRTLLSSFLPAEPGDTVLGGSDNNAAGDEGLVWLEDGEDGGSLHWIQQEAHS